ncbi:hypothetical protein HN51_033580 [Arachis hypogaea]|uniref:RWP-RK domain-containing protein n=1 Tax=Arachis hypogaea TaxID=3818 RepID=A0A445AB14_ARAHY|nr:hypothetical protein DS421_13g388620 [Arachis hypogaea]RYR23674.1 hypothetical protein Ahy_B03g068866 [Arachis hypogaea]
MDVVERCDEESDNAENEYVDNAWKEMSKDKGKGKKGLKRKSISECFYMPIAEASRHLKVGLIHLKRRWRDLGIQRWPHRKLMSLQTLINNLQQQQQQQKGVDEDESSRIRSAIHILEREKSLLEEIPHLQLETTPKG